jgi:hypothetical protein
MRIPPYYEKPSWQRFFAGAFCGALISWGIFLGMYGILQEKQLHTIKEQKILIRNLSDRINVLIDDVERLNEKNKEHLKIQDFKINIINYERYKLDSLTRHSLVDEVRKDLNHLIAKDIKSVAENKELLRKAIENKVYEFDEKKYKLTINSIYFDTTLEISLKIVMLN